MFVTEFKLDAAIIEDASVEQKSGCFIILSSQNCFYDQCQIKVIVNQKDLSKYFFKKKIVNEILY